MLVDIGDGRFEAPSPSLLAVAERVVARGVSLDGALGVFEQIEDNCDAVSAAFVKLFVDEVWQPFLAAGMPVQRWAEIEESVDHLRPLATEALLAIFGQRMSAQIDVAFGAGPGPCGSRDAERGRVGAWRCESPFRAERRAASSRVVCK